MEKGLAQDSELYQSDTAAGEVSPQTRRKQHGDRGGEIPPFTLRHELAPAYQQRGDEKPKIPQQRMCPSEARRFHTCVCGE